MIDLPFLTQFAIFADVETERLQRIAQWMRERWYDKGEIIFHQGQPGEAVYFLREGRVKVYRVETDGKEQILRFFDPGEAFGLVVALDRQPYPSEAEAVARSRVWSLRVEDFQRLQQTVPDLATRTLNDVAFRLRAAQDRAHALAVRDVHARLVEFLLTEARRRGRREDGMLVMPLDFSREDLARLLGSARETVSRALGDLRRTGAIQERGNELVLNEERLGQWLKE